MALTPEDRQRIYEEEKLRLAVRKQLRSSTWTKVGYGVAVLIVVLVGLWIYGSVLLDKASAVGSTHTLVPPLIAMTRSDVETLIENANSGHSEGSAYGTGMLIKLGRVVEVGEGAKVRVVLGDHDKCLVEVLGGQRRGDQGWVKTSWLR